jgi:hypothetical protein
MFVHCGREGNAYRSRLAGADVLSEVPGTYANGAAINHQRVVNG